MNISEQARVEAETDPGFAAETPAPAGQPGIVGESRPKGPIYAFTQKYQDTRGGLKRYFTEIATYTAGIAGDYGVPLAVEALETLTASLRQGYGDVLAAREGVPTSKDIVTN